jgi:predicted RNase H-like nuclease
MRAVLGIDAAWTVTRPSGLALVAEDPTGRRLVAAASSYQRFVALADRAAAAEERPSGSLPQPTALLAAASTLSGRAVDLVAVDMPLARSPILGRRSADDAVSRAYGNRKCGTHTPGASRPGSVSDALREGFERAGYALRTATVATPGPIEVYPHPALVELTAASERLPYKAAKARAYWPSRGPAERRALLYRQWEAITAALEGEIAGVAAAFPELPSGASGADVKAYEDALDAVVCAWVGVCALDGRAAPLGDEDSAIWIPRQRATVRR